MTPRFSRPRVIDIIGWTLLAIAMIFAVFVRVRMRDFPLERDEGEFAYAGQLLLEGIPPYKLAYNMKLPGTYIAYAALMAVFGETTAGIHLGLLAVNLATILVLYRLVRQMFDPFSAGMAAVVYTMLSLSISMLAMAAHATHFVAFFALVGAYFLWRHTQTAKIWSAAASGLMLGVAFLMKQQGVFMMVFGGVALLWLGLSLKSYPRRKLPLTLLCYSLAALLPYGLIGLWLWRAGVWNEFWFWTVTYASKYVAIVPIQHAWLYFQRSAMNIGSANWPLLLLALAGVPGIIMLGRRKPGSRPFAFSFLFFSFLCVCPGFYFREHYFIATLPVVAMFAGVGCRWLWELAAISFDTSANAENPRNVAPRQKTAKSKPAKPEPARVPSIGFGPLSPLAVIIIAVAIGWTLWMPGQYGYCFSWPPLFAGRVVYNGNPFLECPQIATYLKDHTSPDETIGVIGSEPEIFFDAHRRSATGYIYTYGLMEDQPLAPKMQKEMINEIESSKPKYLVFANVGFSWLINSRSDTDILNWALKYLHDNYEVVGILEPRSQLETTSYWDDRVRMYRPRTQPSELDNWKLPAPVTQKLPYLIVYRRK